MGEMVDELLALELPCDDAAPGAVREALEQFERLGWILGDLMLVASELVTNAVLHSGCLSDSTLRVGAWVAPDGMIAISVSDPGNSGESAKPRPAAEFAGGGWGLMIVDQLAARWGTERSDGYRVWAEMAIPAYEVSAAPEAADRSAPGTGHA